MKEILDRCSESPASHMGWTKVNPQFLGFDYAHERTLKVGDAETAIKKIEKEVSVFPFQIRYAMAVPLWERFADMYCQSGDVELAVEYI
jgi:hypothetical protein